MGRHGLKRRRCRDETRPRCGTVFIGEATLFGVGTRERETGITLSGGTGDGRGRRHVILWLVRAGGRRLGLFGGSDGARRADWGVRHDLGGDEDEREERGRQTVPMEGRGEGANR